MSIGALYGASLFVCNLVFASVLHNAPDRYRVALPKSLFLRDIAIFFLATTALIFLGFTGVSPLIVSIILISIYVLYVATVVYEEYLEKRRPKDEIKNDLERNFFRSATIATTNDVPEQEEPMAEFTEDQDSKKNLQPPRHSRTNLLNLGAAAPIENRKLVSLKTAQKDTSGERSNKIFHESSTQNFRRMHKWKSHRQSFLHLRVSFEASHGPYNSSRR